MSKSKSKSPEALQAQAKIEAKKEFKRRIKMIKSVKETQEHDRKVCICEGCHNYALLGIIIQNGRLYTVVSDWDDISPEEYLRALHELLLYKMDKKTSQKALIDKLINKQIPKKQAEILVSQMLAPFHIVFFKPPPTGLMKVI